jgi:copper resistance protein D
MTTEQWFVVVRAIHFGACLVLFGVFVFDRFVTASIGSRDRSEVVIYWESRVRLLGFVTLPIALLSGIAWFVLVAMSMSGLPLGQALQPDTVKIVWNQTQFGTVWQFRLAVWLGAAVLITLMYIFPLRPSAQKALAWIELLFSGGLLGSLAWAGHGQIGQPGYWHLGADILHLLVAGVWPTGLVPLALLLRAFRHTSDSTRWRRMAALIRRFSAVSLGSVILLVLTGWVNSWYLVGSFSNLVQQPYGRWLLLKIALFMLAVAIGAVNLLRLKPRLLADNYAAGATEIAAGQLQLNVLLEISLGVAIVIVVAILGMLPPAAG